MYHVAEDDPLLNPTAEVQVTNIYRDEILEPGVVPAYLTAYCASYRREAGAAGRDTRGMVRVHQFDKVELVKIVPGETSYDEHERLARDVSDIFEALELPYRVALLCSGDLSFAAAKCYDFEAWSPGTGGWLECSSCSNFEDFQARRMGMRFRREAGAKAEIPHTLNASGVALPRTFAALPANHQTEAAGARIPAARNPELELILTDVITQIDFPIVITDSDSVPRAWRHVGIEPSQVPDSLIDSLVAGRAVPEVIRTRVASLKARAAELDRSHP